MARGQARIHRNDEDFTDDKENALRRERSARERNKKRKASKIRRGIDHFYTARDVKGQHISDEDFDEFDEFDDPSYH